MIEACDTDPNDCIFGTGAVCPVLGHCVFDALAYDANDKTAGEDE